MELHKQAFLHALAGRRGTNPRQLADHELWALGQHIGLHTPLLDWTTSPYVALFFAYAHCNPDDYSGNRVLFALNVTRIHEKQESTSTNPMCLEVIRYTSDENHLMHCQGGLFTSVKPLEMDVEQWVLEFFPKSYDHSTLIRFEFVDSMRDEVLRQLDWMNINYLSLFPDVYGSAMHSNLRLEIPGY